MKWLKSLYSEKVANKIEDLEFKLLLAESDLQVANLKLKAAEQKLLENKVEEVDLTKRVFPINPNVYEAWLLEWRNDKVLFRRLINGHLEESYRAYPKSHATVAAAAIIQGFQPPHSLDIQAGEGNSSVFIKGLKVSKKFAYGNGWYIFHC